ncbi:MAG: hypothetical protein WCD76_15065 [Pyrinomonadaceae bacterium]
MINLPDLKKYFPQSPVVSFDERKTRAFDELWAAALERGQGSLVEYRCEYPKYEFLTYLVERKGLLLHGSNFPDIKVLIPIRLTKDTTSYGNHDAVYACADGIWPIFFAIVNRNLERTSFVSSCRRVVCDDGTTKKFYFFSIHDGVPESQRWRPGMVYVQPRESFRQLSDEAGRLVEEWKSAEPVNALAKLPVNVDDFPFLGSVQSHNDEWLALERRSAEIDTRIYDAYVGRYALAPGSAIEVTRAGDCLFLNFPGYPPGVIWPLSETSFLLPPLNIRAGFVVNGRRQATQLVLKLDGQGLIAPRLD